MLHKAKTTAQTHGAVIKGAAGDVERLSFI